MLSWHFDLLTRLLLSQKLFQRIFVMIFELLRLEVARLCLDDVRCKFQHVLWNFFVSNIVEVFIFFANFIRISQRNPEKAFAARFECDDVLAIEALKAAGCERVYSERASPGAD